MGHCSNCKYGELPINEEPCKSCKWHTEQYTKWEPEEKEER